MNYYRIYRDLSESRPIYISPEESDDLIRFNRRYRPGCAQVLDGKVVYRGYLSAAELIHVDPTVTDEVPGVTVEEAVKILNSPDIIDDSGSVERAAKLDSKRRA